jgi:hypothetical protein
VCIASVTDRRVDLRHARQRKSDLRHRLSIVDQYLTAGDFDNSQLGPQRRLDRRRQTDEQVVGSDGRH